jgi:hypothetical protein
MPVSSQTNSLTSLVLWRSYLLLVVSKFARNANFSLVALAHEYTSKWKWGKYFIFFREPVRRFRVFRQLLTNCYR